MEKNQIVEEWFREQMTNSCVSRDTEVYNHVRKAVDELKDKLGIKPTDAAS